MSENLTPLSDGVKDLRPRSSCGFKRGEIKTQPKSATFAIKVRVTNYVVTSAPQAALSATERDQVLDAFAVHFKHGFEKGKLFEPYQGESFEKLRHDAKRLLEKEMVGYADAAGGLAAAYVAGENAVAFEVFIPTGHLEHVNNSAAFTGMGDKQLLGAELTITLGKDPFKEINTGLRLDRCVVEFIPYWRPTRGWRFGLPVMVRTLTNKNSDTVRTDPALVISLEQPGALAGNILADKAIKLTNGERVLMDDPNTPTTVQAAYEEKPDQGEIEISIKNVRTPIYLTADADLADLFVGEISAKQVKKVTEWDARCLFLPLMDTQQVQEAVADLARHLERGHQLVAVSNAELVDKLKTLPDTHLPYVGFTCFTQDDTEFGQFPGLRCEAGGAPVVWIPPDVRREYAQKIVNALVPAEDMPEGNGWKVEQLHQEIARKIPGAVTDERGFKVSSWVVEQVRTIMRPEVSLAMQNRQAALAKLAA